MKFSRNVDFTKLPQAGRVIRAADAAGLDAFDRVTLAHDERHLRRRVIETAGGTTVLVDLAEPTALADGDLLALDDGRHAGIIAAEEEVYEIVPRDGLHLAELCWHIGNRHLAAQIEPARILILRDHVIKAMLEGLGAAVNEISAPFEPLRGAYFGGHSHDHPQRDSYGRLPGDPHYGHAHGPDEDHDHGHDHGHHHGHEHD